LGDFTVSGEAAVFEIVESEAIPLPGGTADAAPLREYNETRAVELALQKMPPLKTVGSDWYAYESGTWRPIEKDIFRPDVLSVLGDSIRSERRTKDILGHIESRSQIAQATLRSVYRLTETGEILINAGNGIVRIFAGQIDLLPHNAEHVFTRQMAAPYTPDATCTLFLEVLAQALLDAEDRRLLQLFVGSTLFPSAKFEAALICYGPGGTGKSTLAEATGSIFGPGLIERLSMSRICDPKSYSLPKLRHAVLNLGTELDALEVGESANFKAVVSGEQIEARPIYGHPFVLSTTAKLWFLSNHMPRFKSGTDSELRRMRFLRFEQIPAKKDVELKDKLVAERDGIFLWALRGLQELLTLSEMPFGSAGSRQARERFAVSNDPLGEFIRVRCRISAAASVRKDTFTLAIEDYCESNAIPCDDTRWLFKQLWNRWPAIREAQETIGGKRIRVIRGLCLT
jgi:P4 family phage/plasmid primase-like protien